MSGPLLHGSIPWQIAAEALDPLREALTPADGAPPRFRLIGERLPGGEDTHAAGDAEAGAVVVLGSAPVELERTLDALQLAQGTTIAVPDVRIPGLARLRSVSAPPHTFHLYLAPTGERLASFDETHQLAVVHPQYDGFLVTTITARGPIADARVVVGDELASAVTAHHRPGPLARGQQRPVDLELHPGVVPASGISGTLQLFDGQTALPVRMRMTVATTPGIEAVLAGRSAGPLPPEQFDELLAGLAAGTASARQLARTIAGTEEPPKRWWKR